MSFDPPLLPLRYGGRGRHDGHAWDSDRSAEGHRDRGGAPKDGGRWHVRVRARVALCAPSASEELARTRAKWAAVHARAVGSHGRPHDGDGDRDDGGRVGGWNQSCGSSRGDVPTRSMN